MVAKKVVAVTPAKSTKPGKPVVLAAPTTPTAPTAPTGLRLAIVTSCSATRTVKPEISGLQLLREGEDGLDMKEACDRWVEMLRAELELRPTTPGELYRGIGIATISKVMPYLADGADGVFITSAGQGLMGFRQKIAAYDFVAVDNKHPDWIGSRVVTKEPFVLPLWWSMINEKVKGTRAPVAELLDSGDYDLVLVACNKKFLKLLPDDILSAENTDKIRFIVQGQSFGNIPTRLRRYIVNYPSNFGLSMAASVGNRNDMQHRCAYHFVRLLSESPEPETLVHMDPTEHQQLVDKAVGHLKIDHALEGRGVDESWLAGIIEAEAEATSGETPDELYVRLRRKYGQLGGIRKVRKLWMERFGEGVGEEGEEGGGGEGGDEGDVDSAALEAMEGIGARFERLDRKVTTWTDETTALEGVKKFVKALKAAGHTKFTSAEVVLWAQRYYPAIGEVCPVVLSKTGKLSFVLSTYAKSLGLRTSKVPGSSSGQVYEIAD